MVASRNNRLDINQRESLRMLFDVKVVKIDEDEDYMYLVYITLLD